MGRLWGPEATDFCDSDCYGFSPQFLGFWNPCESNARKQKPSRGSCLELVYTQFQVLDQCRWGYYIYYIRHVGHINICAFKIALFRGVLKKPHCLIIIGFSGIDFFVLCNFGSYIDGTCGLLPFSLCWRLSFWWAWNRKADKYRCIFRAAWCGIVWGIAVTGGYCSVAIVRSLAWKEKQWW